MGTIEEKKKILEEDMHNIINIDVSSIDEEKIDDWEEDRCKYSDDLEHFREELSLIEERLDSPDTYSSFHGHPDDNINPSYFFLTPSIDRFFQRNFQP